MFVLAWAIFCFFSVFQVHVLFCFFVFDCQHISAIDCLKRLVSFRRTLSSYCDRTFAPLDLACGTLFRSSCASQTSSTYCSDDSWRDTFFQETWTRRSV